MTYHHIIFRPVTLTFEREIIKCPTCHKPMEKHIICEGARFHVLHWDTQGSHCNEPNCEVNHYTKHYNERKETGL